MALSCGDNVAGILSLIIVNMIGACWYEPVNSYSLFVSGQGRAILGKGGLSASSTSLPLQPKLLQSLFPRISK